jgi:hypothetical protein
MRAEVTVPRGSARFHVGKTGNCPRFWQTDDIVANFQRVIWKPTKHCCIGDRETFAANDQASIEGISARRREKLPIGDPSRLVFSIVRPPNVFSFLLSAFFVLLFAEE